MQTKFEDSVSKSNDEVFGTQKKTKKKKTTRTRSEDKIKNKQKL